MRNGKKIRPSLNSKRWQGRSCKQLVMGGRWFDRESPIKSKASDLVMDESSGQSSEHRAHSEVAEVCKQKRSHEVFNG